MKLSEKLGNLVGERKLILLLLMMACGAALILLSYLMTDAPDTMPQDAAYTGSSTEQRLSYLMSMIDGAGQVDVLVTQGDAGVLGVLIVADGAQELTVRTELMRAAMTALDIPAECVEVFAREKEGT